MRAVFLIGGTITVLVAVSVVMLWQEFLPPASVQYAQPGKQDFGQSEGALALQPTPTPTPTPTPIPPTPTPQSGGLTSPPPPGESGGSTPEAAISPTVQTGGITPSPTPTVPTPPSGGASNDQRQGREGGRKSNQQTPTPEASAPKTVSTAVATVKPARGARAGIEAFLKATQALRNDPTAQTITAYVAQPVSKASAIATLGTIITSIATTIPASGQALPVLFTSLLGPIRLGLRRRGWTVVYNSLTKRPISGTAIRVFDTNHRLVQTKVTDMWGRVRLWLPHGRYFFDVGREEFRFPSSVIVGKVDGAFTEIYTGGAYLIKSAHPTVLALSIPMDPLRGTPALERAQTGGLRRFGNWVETVGAHFEVPILVIGFLFALLAFVVRPTSLNGIFVVAYPIIIVARAMVRSATSQTFGTVRDLNGKPVPAAVVQLFAVQGHKLIESQESDEAGRFSFLVPAGSYQIRILKEGYSVPSKNQRLPYAPHPYTEGVITVTGSHEQYIKIDTLIAKRSS